MPMWCAIDSSGVETFFVGDVTPFQNASVVFVDDKKFTASFVGVDGGDQPMASPSGEALWVACRAVYRQL